MTPILLHAARASKRRGITIGSKNRPVKSPLTDRKEQGGGKLPSCRNMLEIRGTLPAALHFLLPFGRAVLADLPAAVMLFVAESNNGADTDAGTDIVTSF